jgi:hypothetical protein
MILVTEVATFFVTPSKEGAWSIDAGGVGLKLQRFDCKAMNFWALALEAPHRRPIKYDKATRYHLDLVFATVFGQGSERLSRDPGAIKAWSWPAIGSRQGS